MILVGNKPQFPVEGFGTCATCKRQDVGVRTVDGETYCADLMRCALAMSGVPDDLLRAEVPEDEAWVITSTLDVSGT